MFGAQLFEGEKTSVVQCFSNKVTLVVIYTDGSSVVTEYVNSTVILEDLCIAGLVMLVLMS